MPKSRTASKLLELRGSYKKHPERKRENEPVVTEPLPKHPPAYFTSEQAACWKEVTELAPPGVLFKADGIIVEMVSVLLAEFRVRGASMEGSKLTRLSSEMNRIGLSPSSRAGLQVAQPRKNDFDEF